MNISVTGLMIAFLCSSSAFFYNRSANLETPECEAPQLYSPDDNHISIACSAFCDHQILQCEFYIRKNDETCNVTGDVDITYKTSVNKTLPLLTAVCTLFLRFSDLSPGKYDFRVTVFANDSTHNATSDWSAPVNLTVPSVVFADDCVTEVSENYNSNFVTCYCSTPVMGQPVGYPVWLKDGDMYGGGGVINVYYQDTLENHTFMCVPVSPLKTGRLPGLVFAPKWPVTPMILGFTVNGSLGGFEMPLNTVANFSCSVINVPISSVVYVRDDTNVTIHANSTSFIRLMTACDDTGNYECRVLSSTGQVIVRDTVRITMECLELLNKSDQSRRMTAMVGDYLVLQTPIRGYPDPSSFTLNMELSNGSSPVSHKDYDVMYLPKYPDFETDRGMIKLRMYSIEPTFFTNYTLITSNQIVSLEIRFKVVHAKPPDNGETCKQYSVIGGVFGGLGGLAVIVIAVGVLLKKGYLRSCQRKPTDDFSRLD